MEAYVEMAGRALAAWLLLASLLYASWRLTLRCSQPLRFPMRPLALAIVFLWLSTAVFEAMLFAGVFRLVPALLLTGLTAGVLHCLWPPSARQTRCWKSDLRRLRCLLRFPQRKVDRAIYLLIGGALFLLAARVLLLPPMGVDAMLYHAVKAGLWVKTGRQYDFDGPSGWTSYKTYPGGAEAPIAWAMLPFSSDLLTGLVDWCEMALAGFALYALCRELGARSRPSLLAGLLFMSLPCLSQAVGANYSDILLTFSFLAAVALAVNFLRSREPKVLVPFMMALGLMAGIKVTGVLFAAALLGWVVLAGCVSPRLPKWPLAAAILVGTAAALAIAGPWYLDAMRQTGYPLSPMPVNVLGVTLGRATPEMKLYQDQLNQPPNKYLQRDLRLRPNQPPRPYDPKTEAMALYTIFRLSLSMPNVGPIGAAACVIFLPGIWRLWRRSRSSAAVVLVAALAVVAAYFQPGFSVVRLLFATSNGRFIESGVGLAIGVWLAAAMPRRSRPLQTLLALAALAGVGMAACLGWGSAERTTVFLVMLAAAVLAGGIVAVARFCSARVTGMAVVGAACVCLPCLQLARDHVRYDALEHSTILHGFPRYWARAAQQLDDPAHPRTIGVTCGTWWRNDNLFLYYFLGRRLQNNLVYVPITRDGDVFHFGQEYRDDDFISRDQWIANVRKAGLTDLVSFGPESRELEWMLSRPEVFRRIDGSANWGAFTIAPPNVDGHVLR